MPTLVKIAKWWHLLKTSKCIYTQEKHVQVILRWQAPKHLQMQYIQMQIVYIRYGHFKGSKWDTVQPVSFITYVSLTNMVAQIRYLLKIYSAVQSIFTNMKWTITVKYVYKSHWMMNSSIFHAFWPICFNSVPLNTKKIDDFVFTSSYFWNTSVYMQKIYNHIYIIIVKCCSFQVNMMSYLVVNLLFSTLKSLQ